MTRAVQSSPEKGYTKTMKLTKKQVLGMFREIYTGPRDDVVWKRETWNNLTDALCKSRQITERQYETWANPF